VRSVAAKWSKNSVLAVDAGVHLAAIIRIFEEHMPAAIRYHAGEQSNAPSAAFQRVVPAANGNSTSRRRPSTVDGLKAHEWNTPGSPASAIDPQSKLVMTTGPFRNIILPCETAKANASLLLRNLVSTYLITHPHLDHLSGFAINTAAFHNTSRPKKLAALPWCIDAIKNHIFNDVIWPNLSDEDGGVGFVSYTRLVEGGNVALGEGESRGYIEVCEGLEVRTLAVSHGNCMKKHNHLGNGQDFPVGYPTERKSSRQSIPASPDPRRGSLAFSDSSTRDSRCVVDSSASFIRCAESGQELLIFGDVEPDSISLSPRNDRVWSIAAPKIACGTLNAIFIECSYEDSQSDETLFGHLNPRHLTAEMSKLADKVKIARAATSTKTSIHDDAEALRKRKRASESSDGAGRDKPAKKVFEDKEYASSPKQLLPERQRTSISPSPLVDSNSAETDLPRTETLPDEGSCSMPLAGLKVIIIHIKETFVDGTPVAETIFSQLKTYEKRQQLGVQYVIPARGGSMYF
jgi:cAMP phosphodiesterase